jgi:hypothetical protein
MRQDKLVKSLPFSQVSGPTEGNDFQCFVSRQQNAVFGGEAFHQELFKVI